MSNASQVTPSTTEFADKCSLTVSRWTLPVAFVPAASQIFTSQMEGALIMIPSASNIQKETAQPSIVVNASPGTTFLSKRTNVSLNNQGVFILVVTAWIVYVLSYITNSQQPAIFLAA